MGELRHAGHVAGRRGRRASSDGSEGRTDAPGLHKSCIGCLIGRERTNPFTSLHRAYRRCGWLSARWPDVMCGRPCAWPTPTSCSRQATSTRRYARISLPHSPHSVHHSLLAHGSLIIVRQVLFFLTCHRVADAVKVYTEAEMFREAILLAKTRLEANVRRRTMTSLLFLFSSSSRFFLRIH